MLVKLPFFRRGLPQDFKKGRIYRLFTGVPVRCLTANGPIGKYADDIIDLLICRGSDAVCAVIFDGESRGLAGLFSETLAGVSHYFVDSDDMVEDSARALCGDIEFLLRCDRSAPQSTGCHLNHVVLSFVVSQLQDKALAARYRENSQEFLVSRHLVDGNGYVTAYGRTYGLFCLHSPGWGRSHVTARRTMGDLMDAMQWQDDTAQDTSLSQRLSRLDQGLPSGGACARTEEALKALLEMPLAQFFQNHSLEEIQLQGQLSHAQFLSRNSEITAFGDREEIATYGDAIAACRNLWEYTGHNDCGDAEVLGTCQELLMQLSEPLRDPPGCSRFFEPSRGASLKERLQPSGMLSELSELPLDHYFYALSCLDNSRFPLWLFRDKILGDILQEQRWTLAEALKVAYVIQRSDDEELAANCFPLLYNLLVEPVSAFVN